MILYIYYFFLNDKYNLVSFFYIGLTETFI